MNTTIKVIKASITEYQYTYNPYEFQADDFTNDELQTLFKDIASGVCVPEYRVNTTVWEIASTSKDFRRRASQAANRASKTVYSKR